MKDYEAFGKEVFKRLTDNFDCLDFEWEPILEICQKHGLCEEVLYDPEKHGEGFELTKPGDLIWWWGDEGKD